MQRPSRAIHTFGVALLSFGLALVAQGQAPLQAQYEIAQKTSTIAVATPTLTLDPLQPRTYYFAYGSRPFAFGDFNGDGFMDIVVAPSSSDHLPERPIEIWINNSGDGTFRSGTSEIIKNASPLAGIANVVIVADFNEDGKPDIFLIDSGLEINRPVFPGHSLGLLLSQPDGSLIDASNHIFPNDVVYNHNGGVADINGDGHLDLLVTRMGVGGLNEADGTLYFLGDGKGNFTASIAGLPNEIAYLPWTSVDFTKSRQSQGCSAAADLDGDGRTDIITGSYGGVDRVTGVRTIRFHRQEQAGVFVERGRVEVPAAIRDIGYFGGTRTTPDGGVGCASIVTGELFGNGRQDVVILWESAQDPYIEILRNDGQFGFTDMTRASFPDYVTGGAEANYRLLDVNGDGALDIVARTGANVAQTVGGSSIFLNDGHGKFTAWTPQTASGPMSAAQLAAVTGCDWCNLLPLVFDVDADGRPDVVLADFQSSVTAPPVQTSAVKLTTLLNRSSHDSPVVEFYNSLLDNYFITANYGETVAIDAGSAGPGWSRTRRTFRPGGSTPVCRFYGSQAPGPNSHFYTVSPAECADLKQLQATTPATQPRWNFESLDFLSTPPQGGGCRVGTVPLYRAYNNGFARHVDSNHRITSSPVAIQEVVNRGWTNEGIVMCAPVLASAPLP